MKQPLTVGELKQFMSVLLGWSIDHDINTIGEFIAYHRGKGNLIERI
jgi:hypothetical protein